MSQRKVDFVQGEFYHLYNRGNSKQKIFLSGADYERFMQQMYLANSLEAFSVRGIDRRELFTLHRGEPLVALGAYCLMPNHFHLLVTPIKENGIQLFMQKLSTGYSMYFNKKHQRVGSLFEGRFKSKHAGRDEYLKYLFSYIHLNPIKIIDPEWKDRGAADLKKNLGFLYNYTYSSFVDHLSKRAEGALLDRSFFPEYFLDEATFEAHILDWLCYVDYAHAGIVPSQRSGL